MEAQKWKCCSLKRGGFRKSRLSEGCQEHDGDTENLTVR